MCGISGYIDFNKNTPNQSLNEMTDSMAHRGPDGAGYEHIDIPNAQIGLGHRRLSILELSELGKQPMAYDRTSYFSPITRKRYEEWLDMFEPFRKTGNILDIGCGYGFFLEVAKEKGWNVFGLEVSERASEDCKSKGITMFSGELKDAPFTPESFDIIISIEVIEHLIDPDGFLKGAHKLLREGGGMYVTTPFWDGNATKRISEIIAPKT